MYKKLTSIVFKSRQWVRRRIAVHAYQPKQSDNLYLADLEHHGKVIKNEAMNAYQTLIVEAQR